MKKLVALVALTFITASAFAEKRNNVIHFQVSASEEVQTDIVVAHLAVESENMNPSTLAKHINKTMQWALNQAKAYPKIEVQSQQYTTHQIFDRKIFKAWRGSQQIKLTSGNTTQLGQLIAQLQEKLLVKSIRYQVSDALIEKTQTTLTQKALKKFNSHGKLIANSLNKNGFTLGELHINTNGQRPPVAYHKVARADMMMSESVPVQLPTGTEKQTVTIRGFIQLTN